MLHRTIKNRCGKCHRCSANLTDEVRTAAKLAYGLGGSLLKRRVDSDEQLVVHKCPFAKMIGLKLITHRS